MSIRATLNCAKSGGGLLVAGGAAGSLRLELDSGSSPVIVEVRPTASSAAIPLLPATKVTVDSAAVNLIVAAKRASALLNNARIELDAAGKVTTFELTAIAAPQIQFDGRWQCRLSTDPDGYAHSWGEDSSFGMCAVSGPDLTAPYEPPLDRIVRFDSPVALRPLAMPVRVFVSRVKGTLACGCETRFTAGNSVNGLPVNIGPTCMFGARDGALTQPGFEPISDFKLMIGTSFPAHRTPDCRDLEAPHHHPMRPTRSSQARSHARGFGLDRRGRLSRAQRRITSARHCQQGRCWNLSLAEFKATSVMGAKIVEIPNDGTDPLLIEVLANGIMPRFRTSLDAADAELHFLKEWVLAGCPDAEA